MKPKLVAKPKAKILKPPNHGGKLETRVRGERIFVQSVMAEAKFNNTVHLAVYIPLIFDMCPVVFVYFMNIPHPIKGVGGIQRSIGL